MMKRQFKHLIAVLALGAIAASVQAQTSTALAPGEQTYKQTCFACHASGAVNAPKFGDRKTWAPLIAEGQAVLTAHAWVGVRGMPPRGGRTDLSLDEFASATAFMARAAGATWTAPDAKMLAKIRAEEQLRVASLKPKK
jgi:cytochrome c5